MYLTIKLLYLMRILCILYSYQKNLQLNQVVHQLFILYLIPLVFDLKEISTFQLNTIYVRGIFQKQSQLFPLNIDRFQGGLF